MTYETTKGPDAEHSAGEQALVQKATLAAKSKKQRNAGDIHIDLERVEVEEARQPEQSILEPSLELAMSTAHSPGGDRATGNHRWPAFIPLANHA
jgi:hypothetical protein